MKALTGSQRALLAQLKNGGRFIFRHQVRVATNLAIRSMVTLQDNGYMKGNNERWWAEIRPDGLKALEEDVPVESAQEGVAQVFIGVAVTYELGKGGLPFIQAVEAPPLRGAVETSVHIYTKAEWAAMKNNLTDAGHQYEGWRELLVLGEFVIAQNRDEL